MKKLLVLTGILTVVAGALILSGFQTAATTSAPADPLLRGFYRSTVASVADAVDQVTGQRGYMIHDMRPMVGMKFVGRAATSLVKPATPEESTPALSTRHSVEMIDTAKAGEVGVIVMEGTLDVAAIGGLMGTAAKSRGMSGMVLDGAVRDLAELRAMNLPVFARSVSPGTAVGRYASVANAIEVSCGGVKVKPGDIIVAGEDGVVVVPKEREQEVLKRAQEIDDRESRMVPFIKQYKSLREAIKKFDRI
jgi:4-hydroxy-4-methyl-2-oxoglutarate aldolase